MLHQLELKKLMLHQLVLRLKPLVKVQAMYWTQHL